MQTRTPENQKAAFAGDMGFDLAPKLAESKVALRTKTTKAGTVEKTYPEDGAPPARELLLGRFRTEGSLWPSSPTVSRRNTINRSARLPTTRSTASRGWVDGEQVYSGVLADGVRTEMTRFRSGGPRA